MELPTKTVSREYIEYWQEALTIIPNKILILEDDPLTLKYLEDMIQKLAPEALVMTAESIRETMDSLEYMKFDLAFIDLLHNDTLTGIDVCAMLKRISPSTEVIIISSLDLDQFRKYASALKMPPQFIQKPVTNVKLRKAVTSTQYLLNNLT